ncbi:DnaD domain protein [Clostridium thermarum]|uniref:DnaD domain protein n=1 Tax=Clostridium thermarum TaxID=1716543 RepID=UPI0013CFA1B4|nr:DnaD domain protein [Clostridium thermarum]
MCYRLIYSEFWTNPTTADEMTPEDRYFYMYLLTNPATTSCGIYVITIKRMAFELGYTIEAVNCLMDRFINKHQLIIYNPDTRELALKNWGKYNLNRGGKPVMDCLKSELSKVRDKTLIEYVAKGVNNDTILELYRSFFDLSTISERMVPRQGDNTNTDTDTKTDTYIERDTNTDTSASTHTKNEIHNLSISLLQEYEKLTGCIGALNLHAIKQAVEVHGYDNVKRAIDKALEKGKLSMSYVNGILRAWAREGYPMGGEYSGDPSSFKNSPDGKGKYRGFVPKQPRNLDSNEYRELEEELL